jgi:hypothetical protein
MRPAFFVSATCSDPECEEVCSQAELFVIFPLLTSHLHNKIAGSHYQHNRVRPRLSFAGRAIAR